MKLSLALALNILLALGVSADVPMDESDSDNRPVVALRGANADNQVTTTSHSGSSKVEVRSFIPCHHVHAVQYQN